LNHGWRSTLPVALTPLVGDGPIILLTLLVLSQMPLWLEQALQTAGGIFLFYLAYGTFKTWRESSGHGIALMLGFYGTMIFGSAGIILLSAGARNFGPSLNRGLLGVSALGLALFGLFQL